MLGFADTAWQVLPLATIFIWGLNGTSNFIRTLTMRQGQQIGSPYEIAFLQGFITAEQLRERAILFHKSVYGSNLLRVLEEE